MTALTELRINDARLLLGEAARNDPDNNIPVWLMNYADFIEIIVTEEQTVFDRYEKERSGRLERLSEGDPASPYQKFCLAEAKLQWAMARVKFRQYVTALREANRSYSLLTGLAAEHPDFKPVLISLGFLHTLIGSVPVKYQWVVKFLGFEGNVKAGIAEMKEAMLWTEAEGGRSFFNLQCLFFLSFIYLNADSDKEHAVSFMNDYMEKRSLKADKLEPLQAYSLASIALKTGHNQVAIRMLMNRQKGNGRLNIPYLDYMTGLALLSSGDNQAEDYLYRYAGRPAVPANPAE